MAEDSKLGNYDLTSSVLGSAIIAWSHCEEATEHLLRDLFEIHGLEEETAGLVAASLDLRPRCTLCIALAYKLCVPHEVMERLSQAINTVQNDLRNTRNRVFHDSWMLTKGTMHKRTSTGPKLTRPQSRELELVVPDYSPVDLKEVTQFSARCIAMSAEIHDILGIILRECARRPPAAPDERSPGHRTWLSRLLQRFRARPSPPPQS